MKTIEVIRELTRVRYVIFGTTCYGLYSINQTWKECKKSISETFILPSTENVTNTIKAVGTWGCEKWNNNVPAMSTVTDYLPTKEGITNKVKHIGNWGSEKWNNNVPEMSTVTDYLPTKESITNKVKHIGNWGYKKWNKNVPDDSKDE